MPPEPAACAPQVTRPVPGHLVRSSTRHLHGARRGLLGDIEPMTVLDRPLPAYVPKRAVERSAPKSQDEMRSVVCHTPFDFAAGQAAIVLKHIAYGYDFAHSGACEATAREWIFVEPGYDRPAFSTDGQRMRILRISSAAGWAAAL